MRKFIFGLGILMFWGFSILLILIEIIGINEVGWAVTAAKIAIVFLLTVAIHRIWRSICNRKRNLNRDGGRSNAPSMFKHMVAGAVAGYVASAVSSKAHKKNYQFSVQNSPPGTTGGGYSTNLKGTYEEAMAKAHKLKVPGVDHIIITEGTKVVGKL